MVLFELEQALGHYVAKIVASPDDIPETMRREVLSRKSQKGSQATGSNDVNRLVQETYISELIDIALKISQHRGDSQHFDTLKRMAESLGIFDIRNAVCHPNRPFPECYWHRIAAIATDPAVEALQMKSVIFAFRAATEDRITPPPDDWLAQPTWAVPNTLPDTFDHEITGLIGRQQEARQLLKYLQNSRFHFVAITGPGGSGKTALCLEVLRDCCYTPSSLGWTDEVVYVTAKTEQLTVSGVQVITDPVDSLDRVYEALVEALRTANDLPDGVTFDVAIDTLRDRRILICLDNLETLLRDHPTVFEGFLADLPASWRVLVTSRVTVNSATVLSIGPMTEQGAKRLARDYMFKRGGQPLSEETFRGLVETCDRNPLAIRLTIDAYLAGTELDAALKQTRNSILEFSYSALLDVLPEQSVQVLECLFSVAEPLTRSDISFLLSLSVDEIANALTHLLHTSLITRHTDEEVERYSLSSSVRDLLLRLPKNPSVRAAVYERLREQRMLVSQLPVSRDATTTDPCAWNYVREGASAQAKALSLKAFRALRVKSPREELVELVDQVSSAIQRDPTEPLLHRVMAHLLLALLDRNGAITALRRACGCEKDDPSAALTVAELLRDDQQHEESQKYAIDLVTHGWDNPARSSLASATRVIKVRWVVAIWLNNHRAALEAAANWKQSGELRPTLGCIYFTALKRSLERERDTKILEPGLRDLLACMEDVFRLDGYLEFITHAALNVVDELARVARLHALSRSTCLLIAQFIDRHLHPMCAADRRRSIDDPLIRGYINIFKQLDCGAAGNLSCFS